MTSPRAQSLATLEQDTYDVLILGGGATGLGLAVDAATRGYRTALVEAGDYANATSSRSTKLIHGGVRYLANGQVHLVYEALHERSIMQALAPHLVHPLPTLVPATHLWQLPWFGAGLGLYDLLSGRASMGPTRILSPKSATEKSRGITPNLKGAILYHDAQFNDARYALSLALTAIDHHATILNYTRATSFLYEAGKIAGAVVQDTETQTEYTIRAHTVINATGIFTDQIRTLDQPSRPPLLSVSRGTHIVVPAHILPGSTAIMVPKTDDNRVIFAIPWQGAVLIGTTDIPDTTSATEPTSTPAEIDYLLDTVRPYLATPPTHADILSIFSGQRPLVTGKEHTTSKLSREHHIDIAPSNLITIAGGKWTTYRRMAQDTLDFAIKHALLPPSPCVTSATPLHAAQTPPPNQGPHLAEYGTAATQIEALIAADPTRAEGIDPALPYSRAMLVHAIRQEHARTLEDLLSRRTRSLLLNAAATLRAAPAAAQLLARELGRDENWTRTQLDSFEMLAKQHYLPA
jgi:glycerol-3-phosphate dehydrogenase